MRLNGYIARSTEAAVAFVKAPLTLDMKPLWIPRRKINGMWELDSHSPSVQLLGEKIRRLATPVELDVDQEFLEKVGAA